MKNTNRLFKQVLFVFAAGIIFSACQKMNRPDYSGYPKDANPAGGPLNFYVAFDGASADPLMNAVDSIRANFALDNPLASSDGIRGKGVLGANKKFIKYSKPNDFATKAKSFTISFWFKRNGQTKNNTGTNGPEHVVSFKSNNGHWSGSSMLLFLEGDNAKCAVKVMIADATVSDNWFTWEGGSTIAGLLDNNWHHIALVYNSTNSSLTLYKDGAANPELRNWGSHGNINFNNGAITEMRIGCGPNTSYDTDDWLSSTFKGNLDQIRMYSTALSAAEVQSLFANKQ